MFGMQQIQPLHLSIVLTLALGFALISQSEACGCATCAPSLCRTTCAADCASCCKCCVYFEARVGKRFANVNNDVIGGAHGENAALLQASNMGREYERSRKAKRMEHRRRLDTILRLRDELGKQDVGFSYDGNGGDYLGSDTSRNE